MRPFVALAAAAALMLPGCSSSLSIDEYAGAATDATDAYVSESQSLSFEYQSTLEDGVRAIATDGEPDPAERAVELVTRETVAYLSVLSDAMGRYLDALESLQPPSSVSDAHDAYIASVKLVLAAIPATKDTVQGATDLGAVQLALTTSGFADGQTRWTVTCTALEQAVRDQGTGIDLGCVRPEASP